MRKDGWCGHIHISLTTQRWSLKKTKTKVTPGKEKLRLKIRQRRQQQTTNLNASVWVAYDADVDAFYCKQHPLGTIVRLGANVFLKFALAFANENCIFLLLLHLTIVWVCLRRWFACVRTVNTALKVQGAAPWTCIQCVCFELGTGSPAALICVHSYDQHHGRQSRYRYKVRLMGLGLCLVCVLCSCSLFGLWQSHVKINMAILKTYNRKWKTYNRKWN